MVKREYAIFNISFKLILRKKSKILVLIESATGFLDLPGGRIEKKEITLPIKDLFKREITEELGKDVKYKIFGPAFQYRRYNIYTKRYVLVTAYEAEYLSGKIKLSPEHNEYKWVDPEKYDLKEKKFNNKEERSVFEEYFRKFKK